MLGDELDQPTLGKEIVAQQDLVRYQAGAVAHQLRALERGECGADTLRGLDLGLANLRREISFLRGLEVRHGRD